MVHSAEHMVADGVKTNQLRAINSGGKSSAGMHNVAAAPSMPPSTSDAQHRGADKINGEGHLWDSTEDDLWHSMDGAAPLEPGGSPPSPPAARAEKPSALPKPTATKVGRTQQTHSTGRSEAPHHFYVCSLTAAAGEIRKPSSRLRRRD